MFKAPVSPRSQARKTIATITTGEARKLEACEAIIGYRFKNKTLLQEALVVRLSQNFVPVNNKRLAVVGDRILGSFMAERWYYWAGKNLKRRDWAIAYAEALSNWSLSRTGYSLGLHECTLPETLGPLNVPEPRRRMSAKLRRAQEAMEIAGRSPMADTVEALIGAVWLDSEFDREVMLSLISRMGLVHQLMMFPTMKTPNALPEGFFQGNHSTYTRLFFTGMQADLERRIQESGAPVLLSRLGIAGRIVEHKLERLIWKLPHEMPEAVSNAAEKPAQAAGSKISGSEGRQKAIVREASEAQMKAPRGRRQKGPGRDIWASLQTLLWGKDAARSAQTSKTKKYEVSAPSPAPKVDNGINEKTRDDDNRKVSSASLRRAKKRSEMARGQSIWASLATLFWGKDAMKIVPASKNKEKKALASRPQTAKAVRTSMWHTEKKGQMAQSKDAWASLKTLLWGKDAVNTAPAPKRKGNKALAPRPEPVKAVKASMRQTEKKGQMVQGKDTWASLKTLLWGKDAVKSASASKSKEKRVLAPRSQTAEDGNSRARPTGAAAVLPQEDASKPKVPSGAESKQTGPAEVYTASKSEVPTGAEVKQTGPAEAHTASKSEVPAAAGIQQAEPAKALPVPLTRRERRRQAREDSKLNVSKREKKARRAEIKRQKKENKKNKQQQQQQQQQCSEPEPEKSDKPLSIDEVQGRLESLQDRVRQLS